MEISRKGEEQNTIGPFIPTEQHLSLSGCHYTIEQGIPVPGFDSNFYFFNIYLNSIQIT